MIDVCLLLEGTYPYVSGGVSTWVHQLISAMKDLRFGIVYIAPYSDPTRTLKYEVPQHVLSLKEIYLHDYNLAPKRTRRPGRKDYETLQREVQHLFSGDMDAVGKLIPLFRGDKACLDIPTFFSSKKVWDMLEYYYDQYARSISFLDYFWTWRGIGFPLMQIIQGEIPRAKIYHSVSTGYAGLLGALAKAEHGGRFFLTEHGIYTHERMLEISQASWIFEQANRNYRAEHDFSFFKRWWIALFDLLSQIAYRHSDEIFTLYEGNKLKQVLSGAEAEKITVIPNGIDLKSYEKILETRKGRPKRPPAVGLIGRVVTIKDVKAFIQSARLVLEKIPEAEFYVIGPTDEEEEYYEECKILVEALQLTERFRFTGRANVADYYSFLDLVVLTSLSEAQPYVILEANAVGIPIVATDVGACREMLEGITPDDRLLGQSGLLTEVANPEQTARAILRLLGDRSLYNSFAEAGEKRVRQFYDQDDLLSRYLNIYEKNL